MHVYSSEVYNGNLYQQATQEYVSKNGNDHTRTVYLINGKRKAQGVWYGLRRLDIDIEAARSAD